MYVRRAQLTYVHVHIPIHIYSHMKHMKYSYVGWDWALRTANSPQLDCANRGLHTAECRPWLQRNWSRCQPRSQSSHRSVHALCSLYCIVHTRHTLHKLNASFRNDRVRLQKGSKDWQRAQIIALTKLIIKLQSFCDATRHIAAQV